MFVIYDEIINKVVVYFRGTEGIRAFKNWKTKYK